MAIPTATTHADGAAMAYSVFSTNIAAYRTWMNDIDRTDVGASAVQKEHLVRPRVVGFPHEGLLGEHDVLLNREMGRLDPQVQAKGDWGARRNRLTVLPYRVGTDDRWRLPWGATFYLPRDARVRASFSAEWQVRTATVAAGGPAYPDGAGGGEVGGRWVLATYSRSTKTETLRTESAVYVYPEDVGGVPATTYNNGGHGWFEASLGSGTWDVFLVYDASSGANSSLLQIDVSHIAGKIEATM